MSDDLEDLKSCISGTDGKDEIYACYEEYGEVNPKEVIDSIEKELKSKGVEFQEVGFFGSRASGDFSKGSDFDFYVSVPNEKFDDYYVYGGLYNEIIETERKVAENHDLEAHEDVEGKVLDLNVFSEEDKEDIDSCYSKNRDCETVKRDVVVREVYGDKSLAVKGMDLLEKTKEVRESVEKLDIDPEKYEEGEVVGTINIDICKD